MWKEIFKRIPAVLTGSIGVIWILLHFLYMFYTGAEINWHVNSFFISIMLVVLFGLINLALSTTFYYSSLNSKTTTDTKPTLKIRHYEE